MTRLMTLELLKSALKLLQSKRTGAKVGSESRNIIEKELLNGRYDQD